MKRLSSKRQKIEREYRKILSELEPYCFNCGSGSNLTPAHLVPRSRRKDLIANPDNVVAMCIHCHHQLDHGERKELRRWEDILMKIKVLDAQYYNLIK